MGSLISAHCDCGFGSSEMPLGGGRNNFTILCNFPYFCEECKTLFVANIFEKEICCPECGKGKVIAYDNEKICTSKGKVVFSWNIGNATERELKLTDGKYICPACGKFNLTFFENGNWD